MRSLLKRATLKTPAESATFRAKLGGEFLLSDYGPVDTSGATNSNAAWAAAHAAMAAAGGGFLQLPGGTVWVSAKTALASANPSGSGATSLSGPVTVRGVGGHFSGQNSVGTGGTRLKLTYEGNGTREDAKIVTYGLGLFRFENLVVDGRDGNSTPFVYTTATTVKANDTVAFIGNGNTHDVFILGGVDVALSTGYGLATAPFQGYGSDISGNYFYGVRRAVYGRTYCNQVVVSKNFFDKSCGSNLAGGACVEFDGSLGLSAAQCVANVVTGNYFENIGYVYGIKLKAGQFCYIAGNGFEDPGVGFVAAVRLETGQGQPSSNNTIIGNYSTNGITYSEDAGSAGTNIVLGASNAQDNIIPIATTFSAATTHHGITLASGVIDSTGALILDVPAPTSASQFYVRDHASKDWLVLDPTAGGMWSMHSPLRVDGDLTLGTGGAGVAARMNLDGGSGEVSAIQYKRAGTPTWLLYDAGSGDLYFRDSVNGVMAAQWQAGAGTAGMLLLGGGLKVAGNVGFYGAAAVAKPTVTGSKGANAALGSLLTALASQGLLVDSST